MREKDDFLTNELSARCRLEKPTWKQCAPASFSTNLSCISSYWHTLDVIKCSKLKWPTSAARGFTAKFWTFYDVKSVSIRGHTTKKRVQFVFYHIFSLKISENRSFLSNERERETWWCQHSVHVLRLLTHYNQPISAREFTQVRLKLNLLFSIVQLALSKLYNLVITIVSRLKKWFSLISSESLITGVKQTFTIKVW